MYVVFNQFTKNRFCDIMIQSLESSRVIAKIFNPIIIEF